MKTLRICLLTLAFAAHAAHAADQKTAFTDPAAAGPDFAVQGEYTGGEAAAQVIALGGGKFRVVGWDGGLPGTGENVKRHAEVEAVTEGDAVVFDDKGWKGRIAGGKLTATSPEGEAFTLEKTERKSPTLGAAAPAGAVILFDGTSADAWKNGKMNADGTLAMGCVSKEEFGDCTLHIEFRTPFMPEARGQGRGNSGVYLQDRYEVQVLDSFGLKGENNECGGIYSKHKPLVNMCLPPLSWQTYDIEFTAARWDAEGKKSAPARMTVRHNGVLIHDNVAVDGATAAAGRKDGIGTGPIQLQNHGNPVAYRNIWVVPKK